MPQVSVRSAANELVIHFQLDFIAPVPPQVPAGRNGQCDSGKHQRHAGPLGNEIFRNKAHIQKLEAKPRGEQQNKGSGEYAQTQNPELIRFRSLGCGVSPRVRRPVNSKRAPNQAEESLNYRNGNRGNIAHRVDPAQRKPETQRRLQNSRASSAVLTLEVKNHSAVNLRSNIAVARNNGSQGVNSYAERQQMREAVIHAAASFPTKSALPAFEAHGEKMRAPDQRVYPGLQTARFAESKMRPNSQERLLRGFASESCEFAAEFALDSDALVVARKIRGESIHFERIIRHAGEARPSVAN